MREGGRCRVVGWGGCIGGVWRRRGGEGVLGVSVDGVRERSRGGAVVGVGVRGDIVVV